MKLHCLLLLAGSAAFLGCSAALDEVPVARERTVSLPPIDSATYAVRLENLEKRVAELKEQIWRQRIGASIRRETIESSGPAVPAR